MASHISTSILLLAKFKDVKVFILFGGRREGLCQENEFSFPNVKTEQVHDQLFADLKLNRGGGGGS